LSALASTRTEKPQKSKKQSHSIHKQITTKVTTVLLLSEFSRLYKSTLAMLSHRLQFHLLSQNPKKAFTFSPPSRSNPHSFLHFSPNTTNLSFPGLKIKTHLNSAMTSNSNQSNPLQLDLTEADIDGFSDVANKLADASGEVIRKYFRKKFEILDKEDLSK
jgi:hypothetical protein